MRRRSLLFLFVCFMLCSCVMHISTKGEIVATTEKAVELSSLERQWVRKSLELQRASLQRSVSKEIVGSDIFVLRRREIADLDALINKF